MFFVLHTNKPISMWFGTCNLRYTENCSKSNTTLRCTHRFFHLFTARTPSVSRHYFHINVCVSILWPEYAIRVGCYNLTKSGNQWCIQNTALKLTRDSVPPSPCHPSQFETYTRYLFKGFATTNIILLLYLAKHCIEIDVISWYINAQLRTLSPVS